MDYKLDLNVSLASLSWPLFIGGSGRVRYKLHITVYTVTFIFDYNYISTFFLDLYFDGLLPKHISGAVIQQALVIIPLSNTPQMLVRTLI
jgi:hypothetical protein